MSTGKYSALTGALSRLSMLDSIADNMANSSTAGFKKSQAVFESFLNQAQADTQAKGINFARLREGFTDFEQGTLEVSGSPLHLGIQGDGFFKLQGIGGKEDILYTRQGQFLLSGSGEVVTAEGFKLLGGDRRPITLNSPDVEIKEDGKIILPDGGTKQIPIYKFPDEAKLERRGTARFALVTDHDEEQVAEPAIYQNRLEKSNVDTMEEMTKMMNSMRSFEALQRVLKTYSNFGQKSNEIGTVG